MYTLYSIGQIVNQGTVYHVYNIGQIVNQGTVYHVSLYNIGQIVKQGTVYHVYSIGQIVKEGGAVDSFHVLLLHSPHRLLHPKDRVVVVLFVVRHAAKLEAILR